MMAIFRLSIYNQMKNTNFQNEQDIIESINLTTKLESSLKKILTNKKKSQKECSHLCQQRHREEYERMMEEMTTLRAERQQLAKDNQFLSKELMSHKQQIRELSKEVRELKKYVNFLQNYNCTLKKQMAFWVKKPRNQQAMAENQPNYQLLNQEIQQLKKLNDLREKQLFQMGNTFEVKIAKKDQSTKNLYFAEKSTSMSKKKTKNSITFTKNQENECTSCSYAKIVKSNKQTTKNSSTGSKRKKLCPCHKSYIETSDFLY